MFHEELVPPQRCKQRAKPGGHRADILMPSLTPSYYAHNARQPNTNQHVRMLHYQQKKEAFDKLRQNMWNQQIREDAIESKYDKHVSRKRLQRSVEDKVNEKLKIHEQTVEARRNRLQELLCKEERELYYETVDSAQKGADLKMEEMKQKAQMLKAKTEEERLKVVHQKRIEQYQQRCQELRPALIKKNLMETKYCHLQQMRENEARREADRELDKMWYDLAMKEAENKKAREVQEMLERRNKEKELMKVWDKQVRGKELLKEEMDRVAEEDRLEMQKLSEQLQKEEIAALDEKRRKRDKEAKQILEQIQIQNQLRAQRKKEENALEEAFTTLAQLEIDRAKSAIQDATDQARRETAMYRKHLQQLEEERKLEEKQLEDLLNSYRKEIEAKQDEAKCKLVEAKRKLQQDVLAERAQQIKYKQQVAEQQLKLKETENELLRMAFETNERLQAESDRLEHQATMQYRDDLGKQIEYNNLLRQREREELERQLAEGVKEEEKYRKIVEQMLSGEFEASAKHPFRRLLEKPDCHCPDFGK